MVDRDINYIFINISIMSKDEHDDYLRYGQGILIKGFTSIEEDAGFLTAKGFADTTAKYETFKNILYFKNYRNAIFQIIPAANFEINDELRKFQEISSEENANYKILVARSKSEKEQFEIQIKNKEKSNVCFGDTIMFKHVDSDTYLSGTIRPSDGINGAFTVEVTKSLKEILIFKVLPFRSYQKIGMPIPFDSPVKLLNTFNNGYLTFEKIGTVPPMKKIDLDKKPIMADDSYVIPVKTNSSESISYECVTHFMDLSKQSENPMPWKFQLHMTEVENDSLIQHDIIYFQHTENNGILSTQGKDIILKEMKEEGGDELPFYQCLWEIEKHDGSEHAYILRHLMSGMTLGIKTDSNGNPTKAELFDISEGQAEGKLGWVELKLAKKEIADINSGSYINICHSDWCLDKSKSEEAIEGDDEEDKTDDFISIPRLNKLAVNELEYEVKKVNFTMEISKNCFVIKEIEDDLKKQCLFALSFHSKIIDLREDLKWGYQESSEKITYIRMMQVTEKIKEIKDFLKNCSKEESDLEYIKPIYKRQMICKDLGISELLFELLFYMKKNLAGKYEKKEEGKPKPEYIFHDKHNELQKFIELYNTIYEVIYELIRDNLLFKIYISKWINFVIKDVIVQNQPSHLNLLKEMFRSNEFIVKNFVDEVLIQNLAQKMLGQKDHFIFVEKKYLEIFRLFCIVGDNINTQNQINILNKFIKELRKTQISSFYQITLSKQKNEVLAEAGIDKNMLKKRRFGDYFKICKEEYSSAWEYFVEYLELVADMTKGRNKQVEDYMQGMFSVDILTDLFVSYELQEAEAPIIRLLHNLYAESDKYYPIEKKKRISDYQALTNEAIDVMSTASDAKPWTSTALMKVLNGMTDKLRKFGPINPSETQTNSNLYQILSFICQTLNLGFWEKKEIVKDILNQILRILEPHETVAANYTKASIESKENLLMMRCKMECMNIIQLVLDYDLDLAVRYICKYFQLFEMPSKKRSLKNDDGSRLLEMRIDNELALKFVSGLPRDNINLVELSIIPKMIELSKYSNPKLTSSSISIMERVLLKSKKSIQSFCQQIFVCGPKRVKLKDYIQEKKNKFYIMQDQTLVKMVSPEEQGDNYVAIYKEDPSPEKTGIMQDIYMMSEVIKNEYDIDEVKSIRTLQTSGMNTKLGEDRLINFTDERTSSNFMKQSVLDAENIHLKVLQFIFNCTEIPPEKSYSLKLLHLSYKFLVSLIWNNQNIKPTLIGYLPSIQHHLRKNVGSIDFLKEMYDNNKTLLFNQVNVRKLIKQICNSINSEPESSFYKSKLLDFFRFLIYCNGKSLKNNQILILKIMQDDSYKNISLNIDSAMITELVEEYKKEFQGFERHEASSSVKVIKLNPKMSYLITYFQILESLIDDKCAVNMGKLKKRYPFQKLLEWLRLSDTCWPLKRNIRAFLNRLYYFQPEIEVYMKQIVGKELDNVINDLNWFILIKCKSNIQQIENYMFRDPIRFSYLQSYLYLNLEENLFTLYMLATDPKINNEMQNILHPLDSTENIGPKNFIRICERLGFIKNYFADKKNVYTNSFIKFLLCKFEAVISEFDDEIYLPGMNLPSEQPRAPMKSEKEVARKGLISKIMRGDIGTFFAQVSNDINGIKPLVYLVPDKITNPKEDKKPNQNKLLKKLREILRREKKQFADLDEEIDYKLNRLVRAIKLSKEGEEFLSKEYNNNFSEYSQSEDIFDYITIIIDMNSKNREALPVKEKRFFLNFITGIVEQNNKCEREFKTIDEWEAADWIDSKEDINAIQNKLKLCKLGSLITELLKQNIWENIQFADSILLCGISYLFGGNTNTQKNMIETISMDSENKVMRNLECLISKLGEFIVKNIEESAKKENDEKDSFSITTIDNYDFYEIDKKYVHRKNVFEPETTDEEIYTKTCIRTYMRAFKFLQLLCENNNIEGKNFIRDQKNELKNYDFIKIAAKEIRNIFLFLTSDISPVSMFLLDFILEVTQIPVKLNQDALMNLTFFEDVCTLHNTFFNKPDVVSMKGFEDREELLEAIFFKAIQIILSNFEGDDLKTFQSIDNKLEPKFLVNILMAKMQSKKLRTKQDVIELIDKITSCQFDDDMMSILNIIIIFLKLKQKLGDTSRVYQTYQKQKGKNVELFNFLEKNLLQIEIINGGVAQTVIFPKYPVFNSLTGNLRDTVMNSVSRSTHRDKIVSLLGYTSAIKNKIQSSYVLLKTEKISEKQMKDAFNISAIMSIVTCVYMMTYYDVIINYGEADFDSSRIIGLGRFALSLVQFSMSIVYAFYWLKFKIWEQPERKARGGDANSAKVQETVEENKYVMAVKDSISKVSTKLKLDIIWESVYAVLKGGDTTQPLYQSAEFWRVALYVIVSFVGTFFYPPLFFIHIMDIFCYNPEIGNIFKAIGLNIFELFYVSVMGVVFTFVFCTVTFSNYQKNVYTGDEPQEQLCQTMMDCIFQLFVSGAIAQTMQSFEIVRFSYDTIYGIFFGIMFSNIISGIMLDAFSSLRDITNDLQRDKENKCYICDIDRETLQKKRISFKEHINGKHFLWNYVFFIYYLDKKSPTDYSGLEYQITNQYNRSDEEMQIYWVPMAIQEEFDCKSKLEELNTAVDEKAEFLTQSSNEIEESLKKFKEIIGG